MIILTSIIFALFVWSYIVNTERAKYGDFRAQYWRGFDLAASIFMALDLLKYLLL